MQGCPIGCLHTIHQIPSDKHLPSLCLVTTQRVEYASERLAVRTAETEAMEAEELQNTLSQPNEGGGASGGSEDAAGGEGGVGGGEGEGKVAEDVSETTGKGEIGLRHATPYFCAAFGTTPYWLNILDLVI